MHSPSTAGRSRAATAHGCAAAAWAHPSPPRSPVLPHVCSPHASSISKHHLENTTSRLAVMTSNARLTWREGRGVRTAAAARQLFGPSEPFEQNHNGAGCVGSTPAAVACESAAATAPPAPQPPQLKQQHPTLGAKVAAAFKAGAEAIQQSISGGSSPRAVSPDQDAASASQDGAQTAAAPQSRSPPRPGQQPPASLTGSSTLAQELVQALAGKRPGREHLAGPGDPHLIKEAVRKVVSALSGQRVEVGALQAAGAVPALAELVVAPGDAGFDTPEGLEAGGLALEALGRLLIDELPATTPALMALPPKVVAIVQRYLDNHNVPDPVAAAAAPPGHAPAHATAPAAYAFSSTSHLRPDGSWMTPKEHMEAMQRSHMDYLSLPCTFFAMSVLVRMAKYPQAAASLIKLGAIPMLVRALRAAPEQVPQVALYALFKLLRAGSHADNLLQVLHAGGLPALCVAMTQATLDTVRDMASRLLLDLALLPDAPKYVADQGQVAVLVKLLTQHEDDVMDGSGASSTDSVDERQQQNEPGAGSGGAASSVTAAAESSSSGSSAADVRRELRMYALLVLGRLANHNSACQMDAAREGAVPALVRMMARGSQEEQLHAARLMAIIAQSMPTHERMRGDEVMTALLGLLRSPQPNVVEHAASVFAILAHNPDTHFQIVGWGAVPLLVPLISSASITSKAKTYVLACLTMVALHEPRHADVVCRAGAVRPLVDLIRGGDGSGAGPAAGGAGSSTSDTDSEHVVEYAAAALSCLSRSHDIQVEIIAAGGVPALVRLLQRGAVASSSSTSGAAPGGHGHAHGGRSRSIAQGHAAEALVQLAVVDTHRKRLIVRATEILSSLTSLLRAPSPASRYWAATLMHLLSADDGVLLEVMDTPGVDDALAGLLADGPADQDGPMPLELQRAQVQGAWMVARMCSDPDRGRALAALGVVRPLAHMLCTGINDGSRLGAWPAAPDAGSSSASHGPAAAAGGSSDGATLAAAGSAPAQPSASSAGGGGDSANGNASGRGGSGKSSAAARGNTGSGFAASGGQQQQPQQRRPMHVEPLDSNGRAAATAALLALSRCSSEVRQEVEHELVFQEVWCGRKVRLEGLNAPATA